MSEPTVVVLQEAVTREAFAELAATRGWKPMGDVVRGHFVLASERYTSSDGTTLEYLEDHTSDVRCVQLRGARQDDLASLVRQHLPGYTAEELLRALAEDEEPLTWIRGLSRLAACRPATMQARYLALWSRGLNHELVPIRRAAIRTCYGCKWPELPPIVQARLGVERELIQPLQALHDYLQRLERRASATNPPEA